MALKGTLKDFSVADIFQLIGQQSKSGSLMVKTSEKEAQVVFDKGKVILGTFRKSDEDFLLGTMLLRAQVITSDQLNEAMNQQKSSLRSLGDVLRSMGAITPTILGEFVGLQLKEVLFRLFQWKEGLYEFVPGEIKYNRNIIHPQSAEGVLMDGFRMLDEWPAIMTRVGSLDYAYRAKIDPDQMGTPSSDDAFEDSLDDAFSDFGEEKPKKSKPSVAQAVSADEKNLLSYLDGNHSVQEIIYLSRLGTFETARIIADLLKRDLLEKVDQLSQTMVASSSFLKKEFTLGRWLLAHMRPLLATLFLALLAPFLIFNGGSYWGSQYQESDLRMLHESSLSFQDLRMILEQERLFQAIENYKFNQSSYPFTLEDMGFFNLSPRWVYERKGEQFKLTLEPK